MNKYSLTKTVNSHPSQRNRSQRRWFKIVWSYSLWYTQEHLRSLSTETDSVSQTTKPQWQQVWQWSLLLDSPQGRLQVSDSFLLTWSQRLTDRQTRSRIMWTFRRKCFVRFSHTFVCCSCHSVFGFVDSCRSLQKTSEQVSAYFPSNIVSITFSISIRVNYPGNLWIM